MKEKTIKGRGPLAVAKVLNIEVGDRVTKICVSEKNKNSYQISKCFLMKTPESAVFDGQIMQIDVMAAALREALQENGVAGVKHVTFTLNSAKVASREIMLPPLKENRIKAVVETNAADYFPVDMTGYCISHALLENMAGDTPGCRVQVTAAPRDLLEGYSALSVASGLMLDAIDYYGNSQYQVLRTLPSEEVTMYVDVSLSHTMVTFMKDGLMQLQRNINFGGDELISTLMEKGNKEEKELLSVLEKADQAEYLDQYLPAGEQADCLDRLVNGITRSADFFKSNHSDTPVTKVVLMGLCGSVAGLAAMVENDLGIEAVTLENVKGVNFVTNSVGGVNFYISCIGSLLNPLALLPEELSGATAVKKSKARSKRDSLKGGVIAFVLLSLLGVGLAGFALIQYSSAKSEQARLQQRMEELAHVQTVVDTYENYQSTEAALNQIRAYNQTKNSQLVEFLEEMERKMPSTLLLMSAVCDNEGVILNIVTPGMEEADVVIKQLRSFESIKQLEISTITENTDQGGLSTTTFSVRCGYNAPEPEVEAAPVVDDVETAE